MSATATLSAAGLLAWLIGTSIPVAFIIVIATVVRRHRPDVAPLLLGAMSFELLITLVSYASSLLLPRLLSGGGASGHYDRYLEAHVLSTVILSASHALARGLLLWGIVRLAQPANS